MTAARRRVWWRRDGASNVIGRYEDHGRRLAAVGDAVVVEQLGPVVVDHTKKTAGSAGFQCPLDRPSQKLSNAGQDGYPLRGDVLRGQLSRASLRSSASTGVQVRNVHELHAWVRRARSTRRDRGRTPARPGTGPRNRLHPVIAGKTSPRVEIHSPPEQSQFEQMLPRGANGSSARLEPLDAVTASSVMTSSSTIRGCQGAREHDLRQGDEALVVGLVVSATNFGTPVRRGPRPSTWSCANSAPGSPGVGPPCPR